METTLRFRVAKQRNQTNSNLLGMVLAPLAPGPIFFLGGPARAPHEVGAQASSLTGPKLWDIIRFKKEKLC